MTVQHSLAEFLFFTSSIVSAELVAVGLGAGVGVGEGVGVEEGVGAGEAIGAAIAPRVTSPEISRSPTAKVIADFARDVMRKLYVPSCATALYRER